MKRTPTPLPRYMCGTKSIQWTLKVVTTIQCDLVTAHGTSEATWRQSSCPADSDEEPSVPGDGSDFHLSPQWRSSCC